jgi:hypothetical protein
MLFHFKPLMDGTKQLLIVFLYLPQFPQWTYQIGCFAGYTRGLVIVFYNSFIKAIAPFCQ